MAGSRRSDPRSLLALQRGLTGDRSLAGSGYMDDPSLLAAYDDYYRHVSRAQMLRICDLTGIRPLSVLDMGAGPGSMSLALAERGARSFALVDASAMALELARSSLSSIVKGAAEGTTDVANASGKPVSVYTTAADLESAEAVPAGSFDLVVFGHCLNEIGIGDDRIQRRLAIVLRSATALATGGAVLVIDPATLAASRDALALRDALVATGWRVRAPCTWSGPCPALVAGPNHTCHDESAWEVPASVRRLAESAGLDRDLIKMTWYLIEPPPGPREAVPTVAVHVPRGKQLPDDAYRVVSSPMLNKGGRVRFLLCGPGGRFPLSAKKDDGAALRAGFFDLRRYDLVRIAEPEMREGGWGYGSLTSIVKVDLPR